MEIIRHLSDEQLSDMLLESDMQSLEPTLRVLPEWAQAMTERPETFWRKQQESIQQRIASTEDRRRHSAPVLAWAMAVAVVALAVIFLNHGPSGSNSLPPTLQTQITDPDHELLLHVEEAVQSGGPAALEPAAMLAQEISEHAVLAPTATYPKKETSHEN